MGRLAFDIVCHAYLYSSLWFPTRLYPPAIGITPTINTGLDLWKKFVGVKSILAIRIRDLPLSLIQLNKPDIDLNLLIEKGIMPVKDISIGPSLNCFEQVAGQLTYPIKSFSNIYPLDTFYFDLYLDSTITDH